MPSDPQAPETLLTAVLLVVALIFVAGDIVIFLLRQAEKEREAPLLARRWSVTDLFLALQGVLAAAVLTAMVGAVGFAHRFPEYAERFDQAPPQLVFYSAFLPGMLAQQVALILIPLLYVIRKYGGSRADLGLRFTGGSGRLLLGGALLAVALAPFVDLLETLCRRALESGWIPHAAELQQLAKEADAVTYVQGIAHDPLALGLLALIIGLVGPVAEEVFFRGFGYRILRERLGIGIGTLLSALFFAFIHLNPVAFIPILFIGCVLAGLYERTRSLAAPIGLHCANNSLSLALYLLAPDYSLWDGLLPR